MKTILILSILLTMNTPRTYPLPGFIPTSTFASPITDQQTVNADKMLGRWMAEDKNIEVEVFKAKDRYAAQVVWFDCSKPGTPKMNEYVDTKNPDPALRSRPWLNLVVVDGLKYDTKKNEWSGGNIYDPNSGHTFQSVARLSGPESLVVRGWGIGFFGKSLKFKRVPR